MAIKKKSKKQPEQAPDEELLKSDVASFASSLGLSSSSTAPNSGFNDTDFRKKGPLKPKNKTPPKKPEPINGAKEESKKKPNSNNKKDQQQPKPRAAPPLSLPEDNPKVYDKFKGLPALPLVKAGSLGSWYADAAELEGRVLGSEAKRRVEYRDVEEWKRLVEKKKELAERLMAQYTKDYESSRGQTGDIKMLIATQRSGTAVDKVSAFTVMVGENPIANLRSLDALLGN